MRTTTVLRGSRPRSALPARGTDERAERELAALLGDDYRPPSRRWPAIWIRPVMLVNAAVAALVVAGVVLTFALVGSRHLPAARGLGMPAAPSSSAPAPDVSAALSAFREFADAQSTGGDYTISYVVTTAGAADTTFYGSASTSVNYDLPDTPAVAFVATGSFLPKDFSRPMGATPGPPARFLTRVAALSDGGTMDTGLTETPPDLASLGVPTLALRK